MTCILRALAFAAAALAAVTAQADIFNVATGEGSVYFVAIDADANIAFTADLGMRLSDFTNSTTFTSGLAAPVTWNFATNAVSVDFAGTEAWSTAYSTFTSTQTGGNFQWGVIAGDNVSAGTVTNRNTLSTGNATQGQMTALTTTQPLSTANGNIAQWEATTVAIGNMNAADTNGAAAVTSANGLAYLSNPGALGGNFNGVNTWNYLLANGVSSTFQRAQQATGGVITQFGNPNAVDSLAANPITFTFDIATNTLVWAGDLLCRPPHCVLPEVPPVPSVPEPGGLALMVLGLPLAIWLSSGKQKPRHRKGSLLN